MEIKFGIFINRIYSIYCPINFIRDKIYINYFWFNNFEWKIYSKMYSLKDLMYDNYIYKKYLYTRVRRDELTCACWKMILPLVLTCLFFISVVKFFIDVI